jgi:hypothetical protein
MPEVGMLAHDVLGGAIEGASFRCRPWARALFDQTRDGEQQIRLTVISRLPMSVRNEGTARAATGGAREVSHSRKSDVRPHLCDPALLGHPAR